MIRVRSSTVRSAAMCQGKVAFANAQLAHKAAKRGKRKGRIREAYRCLVCNQFHIGAPMTVRAKPEPREIRRPKNRNGVRDAWGQE